MSCNRKHDLVTLLALSFRKYNFRERSVSQTQSQLYIWLISFTVIWMPFCVTGEYKKEEFGIEAVVYWITNVCVGQLHDHHLVMVVCMHMFVHIQVPLCASTCATDTLRYRQTVFCLLFGFHFFLLFELKCNPLRYLAYLTSASVRFWGNY